MKNTRRVLHLFVWLDLEASPTLQAKPGQENNLFEIIRRVPHLEAKPLPFELPIPTSAPRLQMLSNEAGAGSAVNSRRA